LKNYIITNDEHGYPIKVAVKKPKAKNSEASIQKQIAEVFVRNGWEVVRYNSGVMQGDGRYVVFCSNITTGLNSGHPDLICFKDLKAVRIEVKAEGGKLSANQIKYALSGVKYGNPVIVLRSKDDAIRFIGIMEQYGLEMAVHNFYRDLKASLPKTA